MVEHGIALLKLYIGEVCRARLRLPLNRGLIRSHDEARGRL